MFPPQFSRSLSSLYFTPLLSDCCLLASLCWLLCALPLCLLLALQVLELISSCSNHKDFALLGWTWLSVPHCTALSEYVQYDVMKHNRQGLKNCVTASDLSLCLYVCVCMSLCPICVYFHSVPCLPLYVFVCHLLYMVISRPDSAEGFSSCPSAGSRNGEKDWENDSTTSSTPSNTEYTGITCTAYLI